MASGDVNVSVLAGGNVDKIKAIDLIKHINYPEQLVPDANMPGTKGFRIEVAGNSEEVGEAKHTFTKDIYISDMVVTCERYDDLDYWEVEFGLDNKLCETMYTLDAPTNSAASNGFQIFPKIPADTEIRFKFYNKSGIQKKVWFTLGYMYKST